MLGLVFSAWLPTRLLGCAAGLPPTADSRSSGEVDSLAATRGADELATEASRDASRADELATEASRDASRADELATEASRDASRADGADPDAPAGDAVESDDSAALAGDAVESDDSAAPAGDAVESDDSAALAGDAVESDDSAALAGDAVESDDSAALAGDAVESDERSASTDPAGSFDGACVTGVRDGAGLVESALDCDFDAFLAASSIAFGLKIVVASSASQSSAS